MNAVDHRRVFFTLMGSLVALAWLTLLIWEQSPYGRYLDHGDWTRIGLAASICRALPAGEVLVPALLYVGGWMLMCAAMMLPTTFPLIEIFRRLTARRPNRRWLMALLLSGYLIAWGAFGLLAHAVDLGLRELAERSLWLTFNGWVLGGIVLAVAGLFQFSSLKYRCLDKCRAPLSFVARNWRGGQDSAQALKLGIHHGLYCVGCCWALMLLMFVVGTGNVGWMMLLGAVMAAEKNLPWGRRFAPVLGFGLLAWATGVFAVGSGIA
jgi:predicted metal-binding membrane protein